MKNDTQKQEAYCVKCREKRAMKEVEAKKTANGRDMLSGKCSVCETKMNKFVAKKA